MDSPTLALAYTLSLVSQFSHMHPAIAQGVEHFNSQRFFEAHEALESLWLEVQGDEKLFLHGLIQVAAAFHHYQRGNLRGFNSLLRKGTAKLERSSANPFGLRIQDFLAQIRPWLATEESTVQGSHALPMLRVFNEPRPLSYS